MHELEQFDDGSTAFVAGQNQDAWHRLGTVLPTGLTAHDVMTYARLGGWDVRKQQVSAPILNEDGVSMVGVPGKYVTLRTNPVTGAEEIIGGAMFNGIVGQTYKPFQNEWLCDYLQTLTDEGGAFMATAGTMRNGADVFVTMEMPERMTIGGTDKLKLYIAVLNNHTGNRAITALVTPVRIVCANTQAAALRGAKSSFAIRHTETAGERVDEAREQLGLTWRYLQEFQYEAERMIQTSLDEEAFRKVCREIWKPLPDAASGRSHTLAANRDNSLQYLFTEGENNANIRGTRWAGYQAVTEYLDHVMPANGEGEQKLINRAVRSVDGSVVKKKQEAFALLKV